MMNTSSIDRVIGSRLRKRRIASGIAKSTLAQIIGTTETQIDSYERGELRIYPKVMFMLCRELCVNVSFFFESWTKGSQEPAAAIRRIAAE